MSTNTNAPSRNREALIDDVLNVHLQVLHTMQSLAVPSWCQLDLTMSQAKGLLLIGHRDEMTIGRLAHELGIGQPGASLLVDKLVHMGWVDRSEDPADRRRALTRLTPGGRELVERVERIRREVLRDWLSNMSDADLAALDTGLRALAAAIPEHPSTPEPVPS